MQAAFEEIAIEIIKIYIDTKKYDNVNNGASWNATYDAYIQDPYFMAQTVKNIADDLAQNYRNRVVEWDKENFDREVEKMLSTQEN